MYERNGFRGAVERKPALAASTTGARGFPLGVLLERLGEPLLARVRAALDAGLLGVL
jgi:hypothetical protein